MRDEAGGLLRGTALRAAGPLHSGLPRLLGGPEGSVGSGSEGASGQLKGAGLSGGASWGAAFGSTTGRATSSLLGPLRSTVG